MDGSQSMCNCDLWPDVAAILWITWEYSRPDLIYAFSTWSEHSQMNLTSITTNNCLHIAQIWAPPIIDIPHTDLDHAQTVETRLGACWVMFESISRFFEDFDSLFFVCVFWAQFALCMKILFYGNIVIV